MNKFIPKISKEEVNQLETTEFSGKIYLIDEENKIKPAIEFLSGQCLVGIDTETKPSFQRGVYHKVSLMQIATSDKCYLFRLNKIGFPQELLDFLANPNILKIGLSLKDDFMNLNKTNRINPNNFIDIQSIVKEYGIFELSLQKVFAIIFNKKISKSQRLTNWENDKLTLRQQKYAATDAWACLEIYQQLLKEEKLTKKQLVQLANSLIINAKNEI